MRHPASRVLIAVPMGLLLCGIGCALPEGEGRAAENAVAAEAGRDLGPLVEKLNKPVSSTFAGVPLSRILNYLQTSTGATLVMDPVVQDRNIDIKLDNLSAKDALDLLSDMAGIDYEFRKGVIWVSTREGIAARHAVMHRYDVREFLLAPQDFVGPTISMGGGGLNPGVKFDSEAEGSEDRSFTGESLADYIKTYIARESWNESCNSISFTHGFLHIVNAPEVHRRIQAYFDELRKGAGRMVVLEARYISMDAGAWKALLGKEGEKPSFYLDENQAKMLDEALASGNAAIVEQGRTTCYNDQRVNITSVRQHAYIQGLTAVVQVSSVGMNPEVGYVQDGMVLDVRPVILNEGKAFHLEVRGTVARLAGAMREQKLPAPGAGANPAGPGVTTQGAAAVELPEVDMQAFRTSVRVPNGRTAVFTTTSELAGAKDKRILVLALKAAVAPTE